MKEKVVNKIMYYIKKNNKTIDDVKLEEISYGLQGLYALITKSFVVIVLSIILNIFNNFLLFLLFYGFYRGIGYGTHAKSNLQCWFFSIILLLGMCMLFSNIYIYLNIKIIIWLLCFINCIIFCPADTEKRPMINKKRKLKFKFACIILLLIYLFLIINCNYCSNMILGGMCLESLLINPLGYLLMGQKVRFKLNDIFNLKR